MIDPDFEIRRLRWALQETGYETFEIDAVCSQAFDDMNDSILNAVSAATSEAVSYAESVGINEFLEDIDVHQDGWLFRITTRSGKTDYTIDRVENLPNLLKNADTADDGTKYKVIPIKDRPKIGKSMFDMMKDQENTQRQARAVLIEKNAARSTRANSIVDGVRHSINASLAARKAQSMGGTTSFRTATSKQDPQKDWVIPEIGRDMTQFLFDLNDKLANSVDEAVHDTMAHYIREYA